MTSPVVEILRQHASPLQPQPAPLRPQLQFVPGIEGVLFDVYGTLLVSGCGDVGTAAVHGRVAALEATWETFGIPFPVPAEQIVHLHEETIRKHHARAHADGVDFPEVDIVAVWRDVLRELERRSESGEMIRIDAERLAVEYEVRVNPVWPMPGMVDCLRDLRRRSLFLGVISNAQFYTPLLFPALTGSTLEQLGFDQELMCFSFQCGHAKPGVALFQAAAATLAARGVRPAEVLYVGNDMLNDITPAAAVGFRTALFAGDARSLRLRDDDVRVHGIRPDLVFTKLSQAVACVADN